MTPDLSIPDRFRAARERAGLSLDQTAERAGIPFACVRDLESYPQELLMCYSAADLQHFAALFNVRPLDLLGTAECPDPLSATDLAAAIREHCRQNNLTPDAFSAAAGWDISRALDTPHLFLTDYILDGLRHICHAVGLDWQRFICGLQPKIPAP